MMRLGHVGMEQGATGAWMPGPCALLVRLYCTSIQWQVLNSFIPKCVLLKERAKQPPFAFSKLPVSHMWDFTRLGRADALRWGQLEGEAKGNLLYFSLSHVADLSHLYFNCLRVCDIVKCSVRAGSPPGISGKEKLQCLHLQAEADLGTHRSYRRAQLGLHDVMSYFAAFKSRVHHTLWMKRRQVTLD